LWHSNKNRFEPTDSQLILKKKIYYYDQQTLRYENETVPTRIIIGRFFRFAGLSTLIAAIISGVFFVFWGSPIDYVLQLKANHIKQNLVAINNQIDSLEAGLHGRHFLDDQYYRELLELDSVPVAVRLAGTGGTENSPVIADYDHHSIITSASTNLKSLKNQIRVQDVSYSLILKEALKYNTEIKYIPAIQPVKPANNLWISSYYGKRVDPFTKRHRRHKGIDFVGPTNTEIYATADGIITNTKDSNRGYGKEIIISHKFGYSTRYAHLNGILVKEGDSVKRGQLIGLMGNTGRSTGTHLHYEVRLNKRQVNPIYYFSDDLTSEEYELITELSLKDKK
jgi:murein DD-endopeptidase MepM/ murein hydrolase activator NlpD